MSLVQSQHGARNTRLRGGMLVEWLNFSLLTDLVGLESSKTSNTKRILSQVGYTGKGGTGQGSMDLKLSF
jgi:hypothetical protein